MLSQFTGSICLHINNIAIETLSLCYLKKKKRNDPTCPFPLEEGHEHKNVMLSQQIAHEKNWPIIIVDTK